MTRYTAVVDRIEAGRTEGERLATLVLEADGRSVDELVVPVEQLPADGRRTDTVLSVVVEDERLVEATVSEGTGEERVERNRRRLNRLARRIPRPNEGEDRDDEEVPGDGVPDEARRDRVADDGAADEDGRRAADEAVSDADRDDPGSTSWPRHQ